jgi:hypothetical protein
MHAFQLLEVALKSNAADVPAFVHSPHVPVLPLTEYIATLLMAEPTPSKLAPNCNGKVGVAKDV